MVWFIISNFFLTLSASTPPSLLGKVPPTVKQAIQDASKRYQLDPRLVLAIAKVESNLNPTAISPDGARGLMQIMRGTGDSLGLAHTYEIHNHLNAACQYLRMLFIQFRSNLPLVLAAYNAGPGAVEKHKGIPPFSETQKYVKKVLDLYGQLKNEKLR